jgi:hypothetical protein
MNSDGSTASIHGAAQLALQKRRDRTPKLPSTSVITSKPASERNSLLFDLVFIQATFGPPLLPMVRRNMANRNGIRLETPEQLQDKKKKQSNIVCLCCTYHHSARRKDYGVRVHTSAKDRKHQEQYDAHESVVERDEGFRACPFR